jgi:hypothetical protein
MIYSAKKVSENKIAKAQDSLLLAPTAALTMCIMARDQKGLSKTCSNGQRACLVA